MFKSLADLYQLIQHKNLGKRLVLAVSNDVHSLSAVAKSAANGLIKPVFIGDSDETKRLLTQIGYALEPDDILIDEPNVERAVELAVKMVSSGEAQILMKGNVPSPTLLKAVLNKEWGLRSGKLLSHFSLFEVEAYHKLIGVTDVALNIAPNLQDKIAIINNSVAYMNKLGIRKPKVAVLGAIEMVNELMQATLDAALLSKMNQRDQIVNCIIDGPLAFDNAVSFESSEHKKIKSQVAGDTDILLIPDIEVGNVLYKSLVFFAKAKVASLVLGASAPIVFTSRSDSEQTKLDSIMLALLTL